jgi:hypothetical protein
MNRRAWFLPRFRPGQPGREMDSNFRFVYNDQHPTFSNLNYLLNNFLGFDATKSLIADRFVAALVPATDPGVRSLIPADDPLESASWFLLDSEGRMLETGSALRNGEDAFKAIHGLVERHAEAGDS